MLFRLHGSYTPETPRKTRNESPLSHAKLNTFPFLAISADYLCPSSCAQLSLGRTPCNSLFLQFGQELDIYVYVKKTTVFRLEGPSLYMSQ